ncbi:hypothetical protein Lal_00002932 [Lupinus albus]|uniref:Uncharacterized protein n=1 Tax=Lupinus albus TaxID=3870 RepID=A0A6A4NMU0_LUPAL|nr:hypothetical protein Lalb_Chr22g0349611 [Lupinus albus]KAF1882751.1 hypothetical protein Lal_00002932 [Lupinus albus]
MKSWCNCYIPSQIHVVIKSILISSSICGISIFITMSLMSTTKVQVTKSSVQVQVQVQDVSAPTSVEHLVFGVGSGRSLWPKRKKHVKLYWKPNEMRGCVFLGTLPHQQNNDTSLPPLCLSSNTSQFRYTWGRTGQLSANRMTRMVKDIVNMNYSNVRWYVFGDDDTVFFPHNLVKTLSKYDHRLSYYLGAPSESYLAAHAFSFNMAFGGGGIVISSSLAQVLAKVVDSCLKRYHYLYGSDARTYSCITELGVGLTQESGFHQVDMLGNIFGLLATHPLSPLLSLHHVDQTYPIFPNMTRIKALRHLFKAANVDSERILQQTVCYQNKFSWTISVSWGYAILLFPFHMPLPDIIRTPHTFKPWRKGNVLENAYNFNTRQLQNDPCKKPIIFYLDTVSSDKDGTIITSYRKSFQNCSSQIAPLKNLEVIKVFSKKLDLDINQLRSPKRQCCDILPSRTQDLMEVAIRECKDGELIFMPSHI